MQGSRDPSSSSRGCSSSSGPWSRTGPSSRVPQATRSPWGFPSSGTAVTSSYRRRKERGVGSGLPAGDIQTRSSPGMSSSHVDLQGRSTTARLTIERDPHEKRLEGYRRFCDGVRRKQDGDIDLSFPLHHLRPDGFASLREHPEHGRCLTGPAARTV